jgi:UDP-GlcNAc:undecaprenyl-phosphate GlcNAc-1-phosphate transferase
VTDAIALIAFAAATTTAAALTPPIARVASRLDLVSPPRPDRWGSRPTPLLGGVAIIFAFAVPALILAPITPGLAVVLAGGLAAFVLGLVDDVRGLRPTSKLVGQVVIASGFALGGVRVELVDSPPVALLLTILWVVGMMNAVNLVDNMDGLAAGTCAIAAGVLVLMAPAGPAWVPILSASVAGACVGFLLHNFAPAKVYMGDAGSLTLGAIIAGLALVMTNTVASNVGLAILGPLLVLALPIFDTTLVTVTRRLEGRPVGQGGRDHTSHRLAALGLGERNAVVLLYGVASGFAILGYLSTQLGLALLPVTALAVVGLVLFGVFLSEIPDPSMDRGAEDLPRKQILGAGRLLVRFGGEIVLDTVLAVVSLFASYMIRFEQLRPQDWMYLFIQAAPVVVPLQLASLVLLGVYRTLWRFLSVVDLFAIVRAVGVGTFVAAIVLFFPMRSLDQSRAVFLLDGVLFAFLIIASRAFLVSLRHWSMITRRQGSKRVLIVGANESGEVALRLLRRSVRHEYQPVGFVDDDPGKFRRRIGGVPVIGTTYDLQELARRERADLVVLALDADGGERVRALCEGSGLELREFTHSL